MLAANSKFIYFHIPYSKLRSLFFFPFFIFYFPLFNIFVFYDMICRICDNNSEHFADAEILFKYKIKYYKCPACGFVQTEEPYWLEEAYTEAINNSDIGLLKRNADLVTPTRNVLKIFFKSDAEFIDFGAGYGVFVRMMRDAGYKFSWSDKYCENVYAKGFEANGDTVYEALTAYEVFEHLPNPSDGIKEMLKYSDSIMFSTFLIPSGNPKPGDWWYYATDHGQHVSLYSEKSLGVLASKFGLNFYTNGKNIHLLTKKKISGFLFKLITAPYADRFFAPLSKKKSLLDSDYLLVLKKAGK
mgnify:FL=1